MPALFALCQPSWPRCRCQWVRHGSSHMFRGSQLRGGDRLLSRPGQLPHLTEPLSECGRSSPPDIRHPADVGLVQAVLAAGHADQVPSGRRLSGWPANRLRSLSSEPGSDVPACAGDPAGSSRSFPNRDRLGGGCPQGRCGRTLTPVLPAAAGNHHAEGSLRVKKVRISKRHRPASWWLEPLSADPRDRDIMRAKQFAGRSRPPAAAPRVRNAEPDRGVPCAEDRHA